jgi:pimeloyl-ACP methyl ester carboxylesterase
MRFLYLHGFASSPLSRKAQAFRSAFDARGISLEIPALDEGDFEHLTISGQLSLIEDVLHGEPVRLIGSSMGGYLAALYAAAHPEVSRLVLLAPAFAFAPRWQRGDCKDLEVFHYGDQSMRRVHYGLIEDALQYAPFPDFTQPGLIFHGLQDDVVPIGYSRDFAAHHKNARLIELESDHELLDALETILTEALLFLTTPYSRGSELTEPRL